MQTRHKVIYENSRKMKDLPSGSIDLVATYPPYEIDTNFQKLINGHRGFFFFPNTKTPGKSP
jgi:DNA modification methylase